MRTGHSKSPSGLWTGLGAGALMLLVLALQYAGSGYALQLTRLSKEAELERYLADLARLSQSFLGNEALALDALALDALWEVQTRGEDQAGSPSLELIYEQQLNPDLTAPFTDFRVRTRLRQVLVLSREGRVLYDTGRVFAPLTAYPFWAVDTQESAAALAGRMAATPAYAAGYEFYKRLYAPVMQPGNESETGAILCLVAGRSYLEAIDQLSNNLWRANGALTGLMALIGLLIWRLVQRQRRIERKAAEQMRLASLGELAAGFAHELRNPLGIIRAFTEDLDQTLARNGQNAEARDACGEIVEEVDRMNRLVGQFLSYSRGGAGPGPQGETPLLAAIGSVIKLVEPLAAPRAVTLALSHPGATPEEAGRWQARLEAGALRQIMQNLLLNAVEASPRGGTVHIVLEARGRMVRLSVADEGLGVTAEAASRIFEPFFTTREGGAGLGLAISRQIADAVGGGLELAASIPGEGARFMLQLPRAADCALPAPAAAPVPTVTPMRTRQP